MRTSSWITVTLLLSSCSSGETSNEIVNETTSLCGSELRPYIHVVSSNVEAGITSIDAFRLSESGALSHATWGIFGTDSVATDQVDLGANAFTDTSSALSELILSDPPDDGTLAQPGGLTYSIATVSENTVEFQSGSLGADTLIPLIDEWRSLTTLSSISGDHYWSLPIGNSGTEATDIDELGCDNPTSQALIASILSDTLLLQVPESLSTYLDDFSRRPTHVASTPIGRIHFGVVPHQ